MRHSLTQTKPTGKKFGSFFSIHRREEKKYHHLSEARHCFFFEHLLQTDKENHSIVWLYFFSSNNSFIKHKTDPPDTMGKDAVAKKGEEDYSIKPQAATPALDTSNWPLLLKNYDKRECSID